MLDGLKRWWRGTEIKESRANRSIMLLYTPGQPHWTSENYELLAKEGYEQNIWTYVCIGVLMRAVGQIRWLVQERKSGGKVEEVEDHPLAKLMRRPNPNQGGSRFWGELAGYINISGQNYLERVGPGAKGLGIPRELYNLRPDRVQVAPGSRLGMVDHYEYTTVGDPERIDPRVILHLKTFHPTDDLYGLGAVRAASRSIDQNNESRKWNVSLLQNGARPSLAFSFSGSLDQTQYDRLQAKLEENDVGPLNAGRPITLEGGGKVEIFSRTPVEMDWLAGMAQSGMETAAAHGVPAELIGLKEATYENRREARKALYTGTVLPFVDWLRDELNNWLVPLFDDDRLFLDYDRDAIDALQEDREKLWSRVNEAFTAGWLRLGWAQEAVGYAPDEALAAHYSWQLIPPAGIPAGSVMETPKGLLSQYERKQTVLGIEESRAPWYRYADQQIRARYEEERDAIVEAIEAAEPGEEAAAAEAAIEEQRSRWREVLLALLLLIGLDFAKRQHDQMGDVPGNDALWSAELRRRFADRLEPKIEALLGTTRTRILATLQVPDRTPQQRADAVRLVYDTDFIPRRVPIEVQIDVVDASNSGTDTAAVISGKRMMKTWNNPLDKRTRRLFREGYDHWDPAVAAQTQPLGKPFRIPALHADDGYELLMYPGDLSLGATFGNVSGCRCWLTYTVENT